MRTIWGSEAVHDNRIIEFAITDATDFGSERGARKFMGTDMEPEWDEVCRMYWKQREIALANEKRMRQLQEENPEVDLSDMFRRDSGAASEGATCAASESVSSADGDSSSEESEEPVMNEEEMIKQAEALPPEQKDAFLYGKEPTSHRRRRVVTESELVRSLAACIFK